MLPVIYHKQTTAARDQNFHALVEQLLYGKYRIVCPTFGPIKKINSNGIERDNSTFVKETVLIVQSDNFTQSNE